MSFSTYKSGFALPAVLLISIGLMIIGLSLVQNSNSVRDSLNDQYMNTLASEAAEAGIAYATHCLNANSYTQTWGAEASGSALTQKTDCNGASVANQPSYVLSQPNKFRTSFIIGNLNNRDDGALSFMSKGKYEQLNSSGAVIRTYEAQRKEVVKWKTFKASSSVSGSFRTCAIITNELYCWGTNDFGQLGDGKMGTDSLVPVKVVQDSGILLGKDVDDLFAAQYHNCALAVGKVYCWGYNSSGQLGDGTTTNRDRPVEVKGALLGKTVTSIGGSGNTSCAIAGGKIYCWGYNAKGSVGNNSTTNVSTPTLVSTLNLGTSYTASALSTSGSRSYNMCAIVDGKAWCWGNNEVGQVGNGASGSDVRIPTKVVDTGVLSGKTIVAITQDGYGTGTDGGGVTDSYSHVCAVSSDGLIFCWGENDSGQLGTNNTTSSSAPVAVVTWGVLGGKNVQDANAGIRHTCAVANSKAYCWGANNTGQLGTGNTSTRLYPVAVLEQAGGLQGKTITAIGGGANRGCAVADFKSYCWGYNSNGQIGDGTQTSRLVPTESVFLQPKAPTYVF